MQAGKRYQVRDGERWVVWDADWGAVTDETEQEGGPPSASYAFLLDPVAIVGAYRLEAAGTVEVAGRAARAVRAVPRTGADGATASSSVSGRAPTSSSSRSTQSAARCCAPTRDCAASPSAGWR